MTIPADIPPPSTTVPRKKAADTRDPLRELEDECEQLRVALEDAQLQTEVATGEAAAGQQELDDAYRQIEKLHRQLDEARTRATTAQLRQAYLEKVDAERNALAEAYATTSEDLQAAAEELALANQDLEAHRTTLERRVEERTAALQASESRVRAVVEATGDAIVIVGEDGTIESVNRAAEAIFGYSREELVGQNVGILMTPFDRTRLQRYMSHDPRTGARRAIGKARLGMAQRRDGSIFPIGITVAEAREGDTAFLVGSLRDLSPQAGTESASQLQALQTEAQRLSAMSGISEALAHELTQPLTAIRCYLRTCRSKLAGINNGIRAEAVADLTGADKEVDRVGRLIRSFRELFETGGTERKTEDVNRLVQNALALALTGQGGASARVTTDLGEGLPHVSVNRIQIEQVMMNLVRNALEAVACRKGGAVTVSTARHGKTLVRITVSDNGPGIDEKLAPRLFFPFVSTKPRGTGIGLPICKRIVEAHGGTIKAANRPEGGAVFSFVLRSAHAGKRPERALAK